MRTASGSRAPDVPLRAAGAPRLLGSFDPVLLGWVSREPMLADKAPIVTVNGMFRPFALVRGRAVAVWSMRAGEIELQPFGLTRADKTALRA